MRRLLGLMLPALLIATAALYPRATVVAAGAITVTTTADIVDFGGVQQVADLPGPDGRVALREATIAANNTPGANLIAFAIPTTDPGYVPAIDTWLISIQPGDASEGLILSDDSTTIDGLTQNAFLGKPDDRTIRVGVHGTTQTMWVDGLVINSNGNTVRGLWFTFYRSGIVINGDGNRIVGSSVVQNITGIVVAGDDNRIGSTALGEGNLMRLNAGSGLAITGALNRVVGNTLRENWSAGITMAGTGNLVGGTTMEARNVVISNGHAMGEHGTSSGAQIAVGGTNNTVQGNFVGVDAEGQAAGGMAASGIMVAGAYHRIGGTAPGAGNVISGQSAFNFRINGRPAGIRIGGGNATHHISIEGNRIGTDPSGTKPVPNERGIVIDDIWFAQAPSRIRIGGDRAGAVNIIAFNTMEGIVVRATPEVVATRILIAGNSIWANGLADLIGTWGTGLGIDLNADGVTANDAGDADGGANRSLNFPVLTRAVDNGTHTVVRGRVTTPNPTTLIVEVFANDAADESGYGEGQYFMARVTPAADGSFVASLPSGLLGKYVTATARDGAGNTSEFSAARAVVAP